MKRKNFKKVFSLKIAKKTENVDRKEKECRIFENCKYKKLSKSRKS